MYQTKDLPPGLDLRLSTGKAGEAQFTPAGVHTPTNVGDKPFDAILVELKGHGGKK